MLQEVDEFQRVARGTYTNISWEINKREIPVTRSASMVVSSMRTDDFSDVM